MVSTNISTSKKDKNMANKKIIDGKEYRLTLSGNVSGTKVNAIKTAEKMRKLGYSARIFKLTKYTGKVIDVKGKTIRTIKTTRYDVFISK